VKNSNRTLRGQLLFWLLIPLLLLWLVSGIISYFIALNFANVAYDRSLLDNAQALAQQVRAVNGKITVNLPLAAKEILQSDEHDKIYYAVRGPAGEFIIGNTGLPSPPVEQRAAGQASYSDGVLHGEKIRVASVYIVLDGTQSKNLVLVQVAETLIKRKILAQDILSSTILPELLLIMLAGVTVWFGVGRGLSPLQRLQHAIRNRSHRDLSPVAEESAPKEVHPLIHAINDLMARLAKVLTAQQRFIADAAHQLRTPLAGLKTQTEIALSETDFDQVRHALTQIARSAEQATRLANQLLTLARAEPESGKPPSLKPVDLNSLVKETAGEWVPEALKKNIDLGFEGSPTPAVINGDIFLLRQMVSNLLDNAIRYTAEGGSVTARVTVDGSYTMVSVDDTGPGIPAQERERVFERFYRVLGSKSDGSGLGLAIVREIASSHHAHVSLESIDSLGTGTSVRIRF
jgi:two-component system, OmpR family, sensor histidine kinase TctE